MSNNDQDSINILHLPEEVVEKILSYVPEQLVVGQVCKTFYRISCRIKTFGLKILRWDEEDDVHGEDIYRSMLNSGRKINSIHISICSDLQINKDTDALKKIIQRFGRNVKNFLIEYVKLSLADFAMLNSMPNLEQLTLLCIECENNKLDQELNFNIFNLRKLSIVSCGILSNFIIDRLPRDVLRVCTLTTYDSKLPQNLSEKQSKLKYLEIQDEVEQIQLTGLKELKHLNLRFMNTIDQRGLDHICAELKSLEVLGIGNTSQLQNLSVLRNLTKLKKLIFGRIENQNLVQSIESSTLHALHLFDVAPSMVRDFSFKCPKLRELNVMFYDGSEFNTLLDHLPKLERFIWKARPCEIPDAWEHQNLKHLDFTNEFDFLIENDTIEAQLPIVRSCKVLKTFATSKEFSGDTMKQLLMENPNLKSLCIDNPTLEVAEAIKDHGDKLESLHIKYHLSAETLEKLKEVYPVVKKLGLYNYLMMKKNGKAEKCCEYLEVDDA